MKKALIISLAFVTVVAALWVYAQYADGGYAYMDVRKAVWLQLPKEERQSLQGIWRDGGARKMIASGDCIKLFDQSYGNQEVYAVEFTSKTISEPRNRIYLASVDKHIWIGYCMVE